MDLRAKKFALLAGLVALAAYSRTLAGGYTFDDVYIVQRDPVIRSLSGIPALFHRDWWAPFGRMGLYRPLTKLSLALGWVLAPDSPGSYHLVNLLLQALAAVLVFRLARRWLPEAFAWIAAAWFALIPTQVEVVAGLVGRADLLAFVFALAALLAFLRIEETHRQAPLPRMRATALWAGLLTLFSLLSKESAIVLPGLAVLAAWLLPSAEPRSESFVTRARRILTNPALWTVTAGALVYLALRIRIVGLLTAPPDFADNALWYLGPATRVRTAVVLLVKNLTAWLWPFRLAPDFSWPQIPGIASWASPAFWTAVAMLALAGFGLWRLRRHRALVFGALFALLALLPVSNLLFPIGTIRANRLLYLPSAGAALVFAWLCQQVWECRLAGRTGAPEPERSRAERRRAERTDTPAVWNPVWREPRQRWAVLALGLVLLSYGITDFHECGYWTDNATLFAMGVERAPRSSRMRYSLAVEEQEQGRWAASASQLQQAVELYPGYVQAEAALGDSLDHLGERQPALAAYRRAWQLQPSMDDFLRLADEELKAGDDAAVLAARGQLHGPLSPMAGMAVGLAELHLGQAAAAVATLQPVVAEMPDNPRAHLYYGQALHAFGRDDEARQQLLWLAQHAPAERSPGAGE